MKHSRFLRATIAIAMMLIGWLPSLAHDFEVDGIYYNITSRTEHTVEVTYQGDYYYHYNNEYKDSVVIPKTVIYNGIEYTVNSIGEYAFSMCSATLNVTIPTTIKSIEENAFYGCGRMSQIEMPNSVTSIGEYAFAKCYILTNIKIPDSITIIEQGTFWGCDLLKEVEIPTSVTSIGDGAFSECASLKEIEIPSSVTSIGKSAFTWCTGLTNIDIPNSVTYIGSQAFNSCDGLTNIEIPNSITSIELGTFQSCINLLDIKIPSSVISIGESAFYGCVSLTTIDIPNSVESIGGWAFCDCKKLNNITIPHGVTSIEQRTFSDCKNLIKISIPNTVTYIANNAFEYCENLMDIVCYITTPPTISKNTIPNYTAKLYVPNGCKSAYEDVNYWNWLSIEEFDISLDKSEIVFEATETDNLVASISPTLPMSQDVTWLSSDNNVVTVDASGNLTAIAVGEATVTATIEGNPTPSASCTVKVVPTIATSIALDKTEIVFEATEVETLVATVLPELTTNKSVVWSSSDTSVAIVDENGVVTAIAVGEAVVSAMTTDGSNLSATCKVSVVPTLAESIVIDPIEVSMEAIETTTLSVAILPELATDKSVVWKSSDENIAIVDDNGVVTAIAVGEAIITATTVDGSNLNASCKITVVPTLAESIVFDKDEVTIIVPNSTTLVATILPELTTDKSVIWSSSDESVAIVNEDGVITAVSSGQVVITATTIDGSNLSATCNVNIIQLAESITLDKVDVKLEVTQTTSLTATILPETTSDKNVIWSSSDESVAIVDESGVVTAVTLGEAVITVATLDGTELSATCRVEVVPTLAESITLDLVELTLEATETKALSVTILPELATDKTVTWESSDEDIAIVDADGVVTAILVGKATITVSTTDGSNLSATCMVTVVPTLAESIKLDVAELTLKATETATLSATILPELTTDKSVAWMSSDETVATVDENGMVTAIAVGKAIITATTGDGSNLSATCKVIVKPTLATSITLDYSEYEIVEKSDFQLVATVLPELTTCKDVVWSSSDMWVASVDANGLVRAYSVGEAIITASTTDGSNLSASCKVTVLTSLAESITLDLTEVLLRATETATLVATVLPETTANKGVEWSSSNESVATVSKKGIVTAISVGEAIITAATVDGTDLSTTCKVMVVPTFAESVVLNLNEVSLEATETATLVATVLPELTTDKSVEWSSSDESVAVVDDNGVVTAISVGEAMITATAIDGSGVSATCQVTVVPTLAISIELDKTEYNVEEKSDFQLVATVLPEHTTNKEVAWSSSDKWIASVDNNGFVTVYAVGEVIITATTTDGTNLSATCRINVYSDVNEVSGNNVVVATIGDNIVVKNAPLGDIVNVYDSNGALVKSVTATDGSVVIEAPIKGIYLVKVGKQTVKVII